MTSQRLWPAVSVLAMAGAAAALVVAVLNGSEQRGDKEAAQGELTSLAEQVQAACQRDPVTARKILGADACGKSKEIVERPPAEKGEPGATGARGPQGPAGPPGPVGPQGPAGRTPPCVLLMGGCQGQDGKDGAAGQDGQPGAAGVDGKDGAPGADGADGEQGPKGDQGIQGPAGPQGPEGPQGPAGPAGPSCEAGSTLQKLQVITTEAPTGTWILACVLDDQNP